MRCQGLCLSGGLGGFPCNTRLSEPVQEVRNQFKSQLCSIRRFAGFDRKFEALQLRMLSLFYEHRARGILRLFAICEHNLRLTRLVYFSAEAAASWKEQRIVAAAPPWSCC